MKPVTDRRRRRLQPERDGQDAFGALEPVFKARMFAGAEA